MSCDDHEGVFGKGCEWVGGMWLHRGGGPDYPTTHAMSIPTKATSDLTLHTPSSFVHRFS